MHYREMHSTAEVYTWGVTVDSSSPKCNAFLDIFFKVFATTANLAFLEENNWEENEKWEELGDKGRTTNAECFTIFWSFFDT